MLFGDGTQSYAPPPWRQQVLDRGLSAILMEG
jgi:hypothetical protein